MPLTTDPGRRLRRLRTVALAVAVTIAAAALVAVNSSRVDSSIARVDVVAPDAGSTLTFDEEFAGPAGAPVDAATWTNQVGGQWNNGKDEQYYTPGTRNAALTGRGTLLISARTETYSGSEGTRHYTSARLISKGSVLHGQVAARIRMTSMQGAFPAFWLLGADYAQVGWPACGELDVMETVNSATRISSGLHGRRDAAANEKAYYWAGGDFYAPELTWPAGWHVYAMDWNSDAVTWSVDGHSFARVDRAGLTAGQQWSVDRPANVILNLAVGGHAGTPGPDFAASMEVDWVRVGV